MAITRRQVAEPKDFNGHDSDNDGVRKQLQSVRQNVANEDGQHAQSLFGLLICAGGIYASLSVLPQTPPFPDETDDLP